MIKKISELDKDEKKMLLQAVALSEVAAESLTENCLVGYSYQDYFLGLMISADNPATTVILFGDALRAQKDFDTK